VSRRKTGQQFIRNESLFMSDLSVQSLTKRRVESPRQYDADVARATLVRQNDVNTRTVMYETTGFNDSPKAENEKRGHSFCRKNVPDREYRI